MKLFINLRDMTSAIRVAQRFLEAVIRKEKGQYCVRSPDNSDWNGGCYDSKDEAEKRLQQVEYFKRQAGSGPGDTLIEIECTGDGVKELIHLLKCIKYMGDVGSSRDIYIDKRYRISGWDGDGADKIVKILVNGDDVSKADPEERADFERVLR